MSDVQKQIDDLVKTNRVVLFMKGTAQFPMCGFSGRAVQILKACGVSDLKTFNVLEDEGVRHGIKEYANWPTIPQLYVRSGRIAAGTRRQGLSLWRPIGHAWSSASPAPPERSTRCACWSGCGRPNAKPISS
jgi:monothiol glutaredoxin